MSLIKSLLLSIQIRSRSFSTWHSIYPEYSPMRMCGLYFDGSFLLWKEYSRRFEGFQFFSGFLNPFQIFFELAGLFETFHREAIYSFRWSMSKVSRSSDVSASRIAAKVVSFGILRTAEVKSDST